MKYVFINLKLFIKNEKIIFFLMVLSIISSTIIIEFAFGFYHHLEQKKVDEMQDTKEFSIDFTDPTRTTVTKGAVLQILTNLDPGVLSDCTIYLGGRFQNDKTKVAAIDNSLLEESLPFTLNDRKICVAPIEQKMKESSILVDGRYFVQEDFDKEKNVCLANILKEDSYDGEAVEWVKKYGEQNDGTYIVDGKKYICIGHVESYSTIPMVPITTVSDDIYIQRISFEFTHAITSNKYYTIKEAFLNAFAEYVQLPDINIKDIDSDRFYNLLLVMCIGLFALSALVVSILYQYVMLKRKRNIVIYRLCGMTLNTARIIYVFECMIVSFIMFTVGTLIYHFGLMPWLSRSFEYISNSYNIHTYVIMAEIYMIVSLVVLGFMIIRQTNENIKTELGER